MPRPDRRYSQPRVRAGRDSPRPRPRPPAERERRVAPPPAPPRSRTPAPDRPSTTRADARRPPGRTWRASSGRAANRSPPARPDTPPRRPAAAPRPRTANPSSPPRRSRALRHQRRKNRATGSRCAAAIRARLTSPVAVSIHSVVNCPDAGQVPLRSSPVGLLKLHGRNPRQSSALEPRRPCTCHLSRAPLLVGSS
jgi:hypothetical protein